VGLFLVAVVVMQLFVFDSVRVSIWFNPLVYIAFVALLPMNMKPVALLLLGFVTGAFMDMFEGTAGLHTAATLFVAYARRWMIVVTLGRETLQEPAMPSIKSLGGGRFLRYIVFVVVPHGLVYFSLEALTWTNYGLVLLKSAVSALFSLLAVWAAALLFTVRTQKKV
jgi:hypothetical protein